MRQYASQTYLSDRKRLKARYEAFSVAALGSNHSYITKLLSKGCKLILIEVKETTAFLLNSQRGRANTDDSS